MNRALWIKAFRDSRTQLFVSMLVLVAFGWIFVWLTSLFKMGAWASLLGLLPDFVEQLVGIPLGKLASVTGRLSFLYVHIIPLLTCIGWSVGRGSDVVSGGIASGNLELVLTLPVRRSSVLLVNAVVVSAGSAALVAALWLGNWLGLVTVELEQQVSAAAFLPGALNLLAMTFALGGIATLLSACDHDRWRTIWLTGGLFIASMIAKMVARLWPAGWWIKYTSFLTAFEPQHLILLSDQPGLAWRYNSSLLALGLACYAVAVIVLNRRDIPVPR